ncbi:unnamed protein product [Vicia faba]|uniref:Protein SCAR n=1 Tax=Vicia faba TaxID=3906 RepID=A0AAV1AT36_VICFA|nr:unnamed protein product [Vicia faba]
MTCTFIQKKIQVNTSNHTKIPPFPPLPSFHTVSQKKAASSSTSDNNSSFRGDEDEHVELQAHFSDSQSTGKSSKSNVNSSSMKDKSYLPHYDSLSTVVENVQSEPILFSTTKYHEAEIEGLPSNQLPEIVEFQNTDNRKFVMCDDAHVHEEVVSDSRQTNSELLTSGKMLCSDLEPTKPVTLPAVIQSDESVSDNVELNRLGNGADRSGLVESFASKPSSPSLIKDDTVPVYSSDKISSDNLVDDSLCNDSQEGSLCPSIKELGLNLGDEINGFKSSVDPVEGDGHIENPSSYNHVMVNGAITESKDQPIPSVDSVENDAGIITCPASSMISSPSRSLSNPRELVHASSDSYPMESNEVELTQISSDSNTESQLAPLPDTTNILYSPMSNLTKLEESVSAFADLNEKETEDHEVVARESLTALEGQKAAGHPKLVSSDVQMNLNKLVPCDDLPDLGNNIEKSPPRKKILQSVFQDDAKVVPGFSGFDTRQSESTSYGQNDLIQNDTNSFSSTPDNKLEFETYFEPHLQCQLDEQDGEFPLNYEENFGSEKSQSQQMHINQMKQEGTHATSESVSETPADESPSFCSSPQSSGPEINPTQYVTDPLKPLLPDHFPKETENKLDGMPPMPPLPPMQWRMSKVPHASLDSNREELEVDPSPVQRMQLVMPDTKSQFGFTASDGNTLFHQNPFLPIMALESDKLQHSSAVSVSGYPIALPIQFPIVVNEANGQYGQYNYLVLDVNQIQNPVLTLPVVPASMHPPLGYIVASDGEMVHTSNPYAPILPVVYTASRHDSSSPQVEPFQRPTQVMTESSADDKTQEQPSSEMELKQQGPVVEQIQNVASQVILLKMLDCKRYF